MLSLNFYSLQNCKACALHQGASQKVDGRGPLPCDVYILGEGPGNDEDKTGQPFVGKSGQFLQAAIEAAGLSTSPGVQVRQGAVRIGNVVRCRPPRNRKPLPAEAAKCAAWLNLELDLAQPKVILCLGQTAIEQFCPGRKLDKGKKVADYVGHVFGLLEKVERIPQQLTTGPMWAAPGQTVVVGCYHPAARNAAQRNMVPKVLQDVARLVGIEPPPKPVVDYRLLDF